MSKVRVCVIGAGPSGMSVLHHFAHIAKSNVAIPEVVCYEKQEDWGGLWNLTWQTGLDSNGEYVHGSMYQNLWSNGPKECLEYPDYLFRDHFKKNIPSYPPRVAIRDYLVGRWTADNVRPWIQFNTVVRDVYYKDNKFYVKVLNTNTQLLEEYQTFDYLISSTGHFSFPNIPSLPGIDSFRGRVMHTHDFRSALEMTGQRVLVIGSSYSAEDMILQCCKFKTALTITNSYRTSPMPFTWPEHVDIKPEVVNIDGNTVYFKDGSSTVCDIILLCTGYRHYYPYMTNNLRLPVETPNNLYPKDLYKGVVWMKGGDKKLFYIGAQDLVYSFTMFDVQALFAVRCVLGIQKLPLSENEMLADMERWHSRMLTCNDCHSQILYQNDYLVDLCKAVDYKWNLDAVKQFVAWENNKKANIFNYRDCTHVSLFDKVLSAKMKKPFMETFDDSLETFLDL